MNYILCLASSAFHSTCSIFVKQYQKKTSYIENADNVFNLLLCIIAAVFYAVTGAITDGIRLSAEVIPYSALYGISYVLGAVGYLGAVCRGSLLISVVLSQMGTLVPIIFSIIAYGDEPTAAMITGMALLFVALFMFYALRENTAKTKRSFWIYAFLAFAGNGGAALAIKMQQHQSPDEHRSALLFYGIAIAAVIFFVITLVRAPKAHGEGASCANPLVFASLWAVLYGVFNAIVNYINAYVISRLPTVAFYMCTMGFGILLSFVIARFIYREKLLAAQYVGCLIATVGLILLMAF